MRSRLDQIEARLQAFIENSLNFLPGGRNQDALAHQLVAAIEQAVVQGANGLLVAPNLFTIRLNPNSLSIWNARPGLVDSLARVLNEAAREVGVAFFAAPVLQFQADPSLPVDRFEIETSSRESRMAETGAFIIQEEKNLVDGRPNQAFIILNGTTVPLRLAVMNMGRRQDNQIVIDDPRVSRTHAQLRAVRGRFVLFDLNSTGGTFVNGVRISQQVLNPGDVISLAGVAIIYGEDNSPASSNRSDLSTGRLDTHHNHPPHH